MCILRDQRAALGVPTGRNTAQEVQHLLGLVPVGIIKVETILDFFDVECILVRAIFQNELLEVQECPLVRHLLSELNSSSESVVREAGLAIRALLIGHDKYNFKCLLDNGTLKGFLLDCDLDLDTARVGFGPDKTGVDNADFVEAGELAQTDSQELLRFEIGNDPAVGGLQPSLAVPAGVQNGLALNALRNVNGEPHAVVAKGSGRGSSIDRGTTVAAQNTVHKLVSIQKFSQKPPRDKTHVAMTGSSSCLAIM